MITTVFALALVVSFLIPGYIYRRFVKRFLTVDHEPNVQETFLAYGTTGLLVLIITWPLFSLFGFDPFSVVLATNDMRAFIQVILDNPVAVILQLIVSPVLLALFSSYIQRKAWDANLMVKLKLAPLPRYPTALAQAVFYHRDSDPIVEITLKNGITVFGMLGPESCVTATRGHPDLFVERVYFEHDDGELELDERSSGLLVLGSEISTLQFHLNPELFPLPDSEESEEEET